MATARLRPLRAWCRGVRLWNGRGSIVRFRPQTLLAADNEVVNLWPMVWVPVAFLAAVTVAFLMIWLLLSYLGIGAVAAVRRRRKRAE